MESPRDGREMKEVAETEGARRASVVSAGAAAPDAEVSGKARRRQFTAEYKLRILKEADACKDGEIGALLRREGLYSSHLVSWRRRRDAGALFGMKAQKRGPKGKNEDPRLKKQEREIARLRRQLQQAELVIDIQKKVASFLGIPLNAPALDEHD